MKVLNSGLFRKSIKVDGRILTINPGESEQPDDQRLKVYIKSHPELSILNKDAKPAEKVEPEKPKVEEQPEEKSSDEEPKEEKKPRRRRRRRDKNPE